jgi:hypothetical protein
LADIVGAALQNGRAWWLQSLYATLLLSALSLVTLLVGEIYYAFEDEDAVGAHDHGFWGPIFDLAWFVFVPTLLASLLAGLASLVAGGALHRSSLTRYGIRAIGYCSFAVAVVAAVAILQI